MLGLVLSAEKKRSYKLWCELYDFNEKLILNIKYERRHLEDVLNDFDMVKKLYSGNLDLDGEEVDFIKNYFRLIGTTDAQSQLDFLNEEKVAISKYRADSEIKYKKYGSLYVKLCIACGILIAVLLA